MGLSISHNAYSGSHSSFGAWRASIAKAAGFPELAEMEYYKLTGGIPWSSLDDPLVDLMIHSDCEGNLKPTQLKGIVERLESLAENIAKQQPGLSDPGNVHYNLSNSYITKKFIDGAKVAVTKNQLMKFRG